MKKILMAALLICIPATGFGWNLSDHREMSRLALEDVAAEWGLDQPCEVHPLQSFLDKLQSLRETLGDRWQFSQYLQINPKIDVSTPKSYLFDTPLASQSRLTPAQILTLYSTDPDDGRDQNLFLRDETGRVRPAYDDQKWFGVLQGPNSQAFRHIEKPPFHFLHPIATFGFPFRKVGEASRRAEIYHQAALLAFALGEDYWGWRFLANAFHYLEDLHQPYHAGQVPTVLLKKGLSALSWGRKDLGFVGTIAHIVSNSHRFFESYVSTPEGKDAGQKDAALKGLGGKDLAPYPGSFENLAIDVRDASNRIYGRLAEDVSKIADPKLDGPYNFQSDENSQDDPAKFLNEGASFSSANEDLFKIVQDRFSSAGRVLRTAVQVVLKERSEARADPSSLLSNLDDLLGPNPLTAPDEEPDVQ